MVTFDVMDVILCLCRSTTYIDRQNSNDVTTSAVLVRESSRSTLSSDSSASRNNSAGDLLELVLDQVLNTLNGAAPHDTDTGQG